MASNIAARSYRLLRLRLPGPLSLAIGRIAYLPDAVRGGDSLRELSEEPLIERLAHGAAPLAGIGAGMSERVVEVPWVLRRLQAQHARRVLDIGTVFAPVVYKRLLVRRPETIEVADLAAAEIPGIRSHVADVRALPFPADSFDVAICISTLEHIGMNNTQYEIEIESGGGGDVEALRELARVSRTVLVTVPGGVDADMGSHRQYSPATFRNLVAQAGLKVERLDLFAHDPDAGWAPAEEDEIAARTYGQDAVAAAASICAELGRA